MTYPYTTGQDLAQKATTFDVAVNTSNFFNGADWNRCREYVNGLMRQMVGGHRAFVERRGAGLTAVTVHTGTVMADGYRKTIASARVLIPGVTGTTWVWGRANTGSAACTVRTAASEPAPYATTTRDFPIAKVVKSGGTMTITHVRPDWILQHRVG